MSKRTIGTSARYARLLGVSDRCIFRLGGREKLKAMNPTIRKVWLRQMLNLARLKQA